MKAGKLDNFYARLGVPFDSSPDEIRAAFRRKARNVHPDTNATTKRATQFLNIKEAYDVLSDEQKRKAYDKTLSTVDVTDGIRVATTLSRQYLLKSDQPQLLYAMVQLDPDEHKAVVDPPVNLCLVVDKSTSMKGKRMEMVKSTARRMLRKLKDTDYFSVVTFSDRADLTIEPARKLDKAKLEARISLIQPGGGTEIFHGLKAGFDSVMRFKHASAVNHIVLITDGRTYGDEDKCLDLAEQIKDQGITVSALGIGEEWNENFLDRIAARTGGSSEFIETPIDLNRFMEDRFNALRQVYAENIQLKIFPAEIDAKIQYAFRLEPLPNRLEIEKQIALGHLGEDDPVVVLLEILVNDTSEFFGRVGVLEAALEYDLRDREIPVVRTKFSVQVEVLQDAPPDEPPPQIIEAMSKLTLYRLQEKARSDIEHGNMGAATRRLKFLATQVEARGEPGLASKIMDEAKRLEVGKMQPGGLEKAIMYGTKSLVSPRQNSPEED